MNEIIVRYSQTSYSRDRKLSVVWFISWSFSYHSFLNFHFKKPWESHHEMLHQNLCYNKVCLKGLHCILLKICHNMTFLFNTKQISNIPCTNNILIIDYFDDMGLDTRKPVFGGLRTTQTQTDQHLCYSLLESTIMYTCYRWNLSVLASLCSWGDWF